LYKIIKYKTDKICFEKNDLKNNNANNLLDMKVKCPESYLISKFRLAFSKENQIFYRMKCVESEVDHEISKYSESNRVRVPNKFIKKAIRITREKEKNKNKKNNKQSFYNFL